MEGFNGNLSGDELSLSRQNDQIWREREEQLMQFKTG